MLVKSILEAFRRICCICTILLLQQKRTIGDERLARNSGCVKSLTILSARVSKSRGYVQLGVVDTEVGSLSLSWETLEESALRVEGLVGTLATSEPSIHASLRQI